MRDRATLVYAMHRLITAWRRPSVQSVIGSDWCGKMADHDEFRDLARVCISSPKASLNQMEQTEDCQNSGLEP